MGTEMPNKAEGVVQYLCIYATRGSLEEDCRWYYRQLNPNTDIYKVARGTLEDIYFLQRVLGVNPKGIYTITNPEKKTTHRYFSAAETIKYVMQKCSVSWRDWDGPRLRDTNTLLEVNLVAYVKEA